MLSSAFATNAYIETFLREYDMRYKYYYLWNKLRRFLETPRMYNWEYLNSSLKNARNIDNSEEDLEELLQDYNRLTYTLTYSHVCTNKYKYFKIYVKMKNLWKSCNNVPRKTRNGEKK